MLRVVSKTVLFILRLKMSDILYASECKSDSGSIFVFVQRSIL